MTIKQYMVDSMEQSNLVSVQRKREKIEGLVRARSQHANMRVSEASTALDERDSEHTMGRPGADDVIELAQGEEGHSDDDNCRRASVSFRQPGSSGRRLTLQPLSESDEREVRGVDRCVSPDAAVEGAPIF